MFEIGDPIIIHVPDIRDWTNAVVINRRPALNRRLAAKGEFEYIVSTPFFIHKWIPLGDDNKWDTSKLKQPPLMVEPPDPTNIKREELPAKDTTSKHVNEWEYIGILTKQNPVIPD